MYTTNQTSPTRAPNDSRSGFALAAALAVLVLLSILVVTVFANAMASYRAGMTDLGKSRTYYAAEAGAESAMAQLAEALEDAVIEDDELSMIAAPTIAGFTFDSFSVRKIGSVQTERITDGPFAGLYSLTQIVEIHSEAADGDFNSSAILVTAKAQAIPVFQFGVFYEKDLEITNGPRLDFAGWVHSNGNIYLSSSNQYFQDLVTTPNNVYHDRKDRHLIRTGVYIDDATASNVKLDFDSRDTPNENAFRAKSDDRFDNRLKTNAYGVDSLKVPLPEGMDPAEVMQERKGSDGTLEKNAKFAWKADWYITIPLDAITNSNPPTLCQNMISVRSAGKNLPAMGQCMQIFKLTYDKWYEGRQQNYVDILDIDLDELFKWSNGNPSRTTNVIYIHFTGNAGVDPKGDGTYPVVRLVNGDKIENPITIATKHPLYVQSDFNTDGWAPVALVGDAIYFLSNAWNDGAHQAPTVIKPNASNTTVYAAILAGHAETPCDHHAPGCGATSPYGGGLENFPRFLERWSGRTFTYRGSLVSLHYAVQADGAWNGGYYSPPARDWEFDTRFEDPANLPPGTPVVGNVIHTAFRPVF
ncbi:MAG: hypothetical protein IH968_15085 [Gemmatimonadetes bacterium]|nr:hypothetical protein [Gemmatimonadota bacterium]